MRASNDMYVWSFTFIDDRTFCKAPDFENSYCPGITPANMERAKVAFQECGWEGDGDIEIIWIPPFLINDPDSWGLYVWHVKQRNNGYSFIASDEDIAFYFPENSFHEDVYD